MINKQLDIRVAYADKRRGGIYRKTPRVIWKSKSRNIA